MISKQNGITFIKSKKLLNNKITHAFLSRNGGVSQGIFQNLNCRINSGDDPANFKSN